MKKCLKANQMYLCLCRQRYNGYLSNWSWHLFWKDYLSGHQFFSLFNGNMSPFPFLLLLKDHCYPCGSHDLLCQALFENSSYCRYRPEFMLTNEPGEHFCLTGVNNLVGRFICLSIHQLLLYWWVKVVAYGSLNFLIEEVSSVSCVINFLKAFLGLSVNSTKWQVFMFCMYLDMQLDSL